MASSGVRPSASHSSCGLPEKHANAAAPAYHDRGVQQQRRPPERSGAPRVPDAIEAGADFITANTYFCGGQLTDIAQDFRVDSTLIVVPAGATHLFFSGHDHFFSDNGDPNGDYALGITTIRATGVTHASSEARRPQASTSPSWRAATHEWQVAWC